MREPVQHPLCGFYASAVTRSFLLFDPTGRTEVVACRGTGATCVLAIVRWRPCRRGVGAADAPWRGAAHHMSRVALVLAMAVAAAGRPCPCARRHQRRRDPRMLFDNVARAGDLLAGRSRSRPLTDEINAARGDHAAGAAAGV